MLGALVLVLGCTTTLASWAEHLAGAKGTGQEKPTTWQEHLSQGQETRHRAVDTGMRWLAGAGGGQGQGSPCLGSCSCVGGHADCRGKGLEGAPGDPGGWTVTSL